PWPRTYGPQTAKVVGPQGESIWTDKYGRVKVKFHWDRLSKGDDTSSGWVRVSSAWAGQGFGGVQIPRVGDEVVVDFINGDPDRPLITGRVYNEASMPPWELPGDATRMGFMTRSKDGHRDNASYLFFEDKMGDELLDMHAEKNMNISVENDKTVAIDGCRTTTIGRDQKDEVTGDASFHYGKTRTTTVKDLEKKTFENGEHITVQKGRTTNINSGRDRVNIKEGRTTTVSKGGDVLHIESGGLKHTIDSGDLNVTISSGKWTQTITGGETLITSPQKITIHSDSEINLDTPYWVTNAHGHQESYVGISLGVTFFGLDIKMASVSFTPTSFGMTGIKMENNPVTIHVDNGIKTRVAGCEFDSLAMSLHAAAVFMFI
ncbi:type VI secretion system Vgr family protein, partial [Cronobacter dublinensis]